MRYPERLTGLFPCVLLAAMLLAALALAGCAPTDDTTAGDTGTADLRITDGPAHAANIDAVVVTIVGVEYHTAGGGWQTAGEPFDPVTVDLLSLTDGAAGLLGAFTLPAGHHTQLRFRLDLDTPPPAPETWDPAAPAPGTYVVDGGTPMAIDRVPGAAQTGFKGVGEFTVPVNGEVVVTADWNLDKGLVMQSSMGMGGGAPRYMLRPTIRLVVNGEAGAIAGGVTVLADTLCDTLSVYAYEEGGFTQAEAQDADGDGVRFENAVTTDMAMGAAETYMLPFLGAGSYDLIVAGYNADGSFCALYEPTPATNGAAVTVEAGATTPADLEVDTANPSP